MAKQQRHGNENRPNRHMDAEYCVADIFVTGARPPVCSRAYHLCRLHLRDQFSFRRRAMRDGRMPHFGLPTTAINSGLKVVSGEIS
jgi:hypothetical protein